MIHEAPLSRRAGNRDHHGEVVIGPTATGWLQPTRPFGRLSHMSSQQGTNMVYGHRGSGRARAVRRVTLAVTAAVLLSACGVAATPTAGIPDDLPATPAPAPDDPTPPAPADATRPHGDGFQVTVHTDRNRYTSGDEVTFTVAICNLGPPTTVEEGSDSFRFTVRNTTGQTVADDSHALYTGDLRRTQWQTGDCRTHTGSWDQHYWNRPDDEPTEEPDTFGLPTRGSEVPAGQYTIRISTYYGSATTDPFTLER